MNWTKFFSVAIRIVFLFAFASFLCASIHHIAAFFHNFEPDGSDYLGSYALAISVDATALVLTLGVMFFNHSKTITTNGTGSGSVKISLPLATVADYSILCGRENSATGNFLQARTSGNNVEYFTSGNGYPGGSGYSIQGGGSSIRIS